MNGIDYLRKKLQNKKYRINERYAFYDMKERMSRQSSILPPEMAWISECLGWCSKAVDSLADRLIVNGFREDNFNMTEIFDMNNADVLFANEGENNRVYLGELQDYTVGGVEK